MFSDVFNKNLHLSSKAGEIFPWASRVNLMQTTTKPLECFLWCYVDFRTFKAGYYVWYLPKMMPISHEKSRRNHGSFYVEHSLEPSSLGRKTSRSRGIQVLNVGGGFKSIFCSPVPGEMTQIICKASKFSQVYHLAK